MLKADSRDPAAWPRLLLTLLAIALLWPGIQLSELDLGVLLPDSQNEMGRFVAQFWPPAHDGEFLQLLLKATLQTLAIATAGMALALLLAIPAGLIASRALSLSAASRGGVPSRLGRLLRWPVRALLIFCAACRKLSGRCCLYALLDLVRRQVCWRSPSRTAACSARFMRRFSNPLISARHTRCCRPAAAGWRRLLTARCPMLRGTALLHGLSLGMRDPRVGGDGICRRRRLGAAD